MLRCSRCQTENPDHAQFCAGCGDRLSGGGFASDAAPIAEGVASAGTTCPSCGRPTPADAQFCASCGKNLTGVEYGSFWRRFGGYLIDGIIIGAVGGIIGLVVSSNASPIISLLIGLAYVVGLNANGGTLGKRAVGLRLEDAETGEDIGYPRALVRYIVAIASALALLLGYLWCIWDDKKQTWHDKAAGSVVVRA